MHIFPFSQKKHVIQLCNSSDGTCLRIYYAGMRDGIVRWESSVDDAISFPSDDMAKAYGSLIIPHNDWQVKEF